MYLYVYYILPRTYSHNSVWNKFVDVKINNNIQHMCSKIYPIYTIYCFFNFFFRIVIPIPEDCMFQSPVVYVCVCVGGG